MCIFMYLNSVCLFFLTLKMSTAVAMFHLGFFVFFFLNCYADLRKMYNSQPMVAYFAASGAFQWLEPTDKQLWS